MKKGLSLLLLCMFGAIYASAQQSIDLSGEWQFSAADTPTYGDKVTLPGSMLTNGKGDRVTTATPWTGSLYDSSYYFNPYMERYRVEGQMKFPFFLTPERHFVGTAWYRREVTIPKGWRKSRQVVLFLERPHIETTVYVNGQEAGHQTSLSTPHQYDITRLLKYGRKNEIVLKVYNGIENVCVGQDSHSVTDQTQGNWNGIVGDIRLQTTPAIYRLNVRPHLADKSVDILVNDTVYHLPMGDDVEPWSEFNPKLYTRTVDYHGTPVSVTFGMREISISGRQLYLNGKPIWLRGTVENCCFPETGYPPTDVESWMRILSKCKEYGLNHVRFHSYCPPDAAFTAADQLGIFLQLEGPSWPNHGVRLRRGQQIDQYLMEETQRIIDTYGQHPSFVMMAAGNEPAGDWVSYCNDWVKAMHMYDPSRIYCGASVGGGWAWDGGSEYHVKGGARGLDWDRHAPQSADDYHDGILFPRNYKSASETVPQPNNTPIIAHEQGQWCAFPDFSEIPQYTGAYKARNLEIFRDLLADHGMASQDRKFLLSSGQLQTLCYKYEIERNLRTPDYAGFQLLGLNDYSGQGTALVGVLNVHWKEKGYCTADQWRQFCSPVVPLAKFPKFVYETGDTLRVQTELYNAYQPMKDVRVGYTIRQEDADHSQANPEDAELYYNETFGELTLGKNIPLTELVLPLDKYTQPTKLTLTIDLEGHPGKNHWDFWVYPATSATPDDTVNKRQEVYVTDTLDEKALQTLREGGKVLIAAAGKVTLGSDVSQHYLPVFWNTSWFKMRPPHTTGAYIQRDHPLFRHGFPTDDWANLNWWELLNGAQVMNLEELPADYQPPIQPIDTWHVSRKLAMLIEARVGKGSLLMTTIDLTSHEDSRPVARQLRRSMLRYMESDDFSPSLELSLETVGHFFTRRAKPVNMFTKDSPDELKPKLK